jgi:hypothetical protein
MSEIGKEELENLRGELKFRFAILAGEKCWHCGNAVLNKNTVFCSDACYQNFIRTFSWGFSAGYYEGIKDAVANAHSVQK